MEIIPRTILSNTITSVGLELRIVAHAVYVGAKKRTVSSEYTGLFYIKKKGIIRNLLTITSILRSSICDAAMNALAKVNCLCINCNDGDGQSDE